MAEHATAWWTEKGNVVPTRDSVEWDTMYWEWIDFAFGAEASYEGEINGNDSD